MSWAGESALYSSTITHTRLTPFTYRMRHRTYMWLVDLDDIPRPPWPLRALAGFRAGDHLGDPHSSIKDNVTRVVAESGIDITGGRIWMLAHARVFGHVFNPISVYWCHSRDGRLACVVAEVHNTYGGRHAYLLHTDRQHRAVTDKSLYVSPFFPVDGRYRLRLPQPDSRLSLAIVLDRGDKPAFTATVTGQHHRATTWRLLSAAVRYPLSTLAVSAGIRWHGIRLYLRGLPVVPREPAAKGTR